MNPLQRTKKKNKEKEKTNSKFVNCLAQTQMKEKMTKRWNCFIQCKRWTKSNGHTLSQSKKKRTK